MVTVERTIGIDYTSVTQLTKKCDCLFNIVSRLVLVHGIELCKDNTTELETDRKELSFHR